ncbi:acyl-CoA-binding domain-containing protein 6-like [Watersipora subatra]|uniref:acyl-CoA-binding domain-containing protein 6-like n=1 Tax=Watersipora subatra TaxID=2589382 RepID=UPI00355B7CD2
MECGEHDTRGSDSDYLDDIDDSEDDFNQAASYLPQIIAKGQVANNDLLYLYARFKQVTLGPCNTKRPGLFEPQARKKWDAWMSIKDLPKKDARTQYIEKCFNLDPSWRSADGNTDKAKSGGTGGARVSCLVSGEGVVPDDQKTVFDWCIEGDTLHISKYLDSSAVTINSLDETGMSLLHWASDRGHLDTAALLLKRGADVNVRDFDGQTPLHYASACGHNRVAELLLDNGLDANIRDNEGFTAYELAEDEDLRSYILTRLQKKPV